MRCWVPLMWVSDGCGEWKLGQGVLCAFHYGETAQHVGELNRSRMTMVRVQVARENHHRDEMFVVVSFGTPCTYIVSSRRLSGVRTRVSIRSPWERY